MNRAILTLLVILATCITTLAQEHFVPTKPDHVSESDFRNGEQIWKNSYQQVVDDGPIVAIDYWNFAVAYSKMGQPKEMVYDFLFKARYTNKKDFCEIVNQVHKSKEGIENTSFYKLLGEDYKTLVADCPEMESAEAFDIDDYIRKNNYNKELVYKLNDMLTQDQKWRKGKDFDLKDQNETDHANRVQAEQVIEKYGYPGTKMVGAQFDFVVWLVIQHAELVYQEKYLPLLAQAVAEKQLSKTPLRMLLDRIYTKKTGKQLFGSQAGVPFTDDQTIAEVKMKYNL